MDYHKAGVALSKEDIPGFGDWVVDRRDCQNNSWY
jgi:hypothetical protein